jgi:hypothetical protein
VRTQLDSCYVLYRHQEAFSIEVGMIGTEGTKESAREELT